MDETIKEETVWLNECDYLNNSKQSQSFKVECFISILLRWHDFLDPLPSISVSARGKQHGS